MITIEKNIQIGQDIKFKNKKTSINNKIFFISCEIICGCQN